MARVTPSTFTLPDLEDHEPYPGWLKAIEMGTGSERYGSKPRLQVTVALNAEGTDTLLDWMGVSIGQTKDGKPSKLRELLNAIAKKPANTEIAWFDDESFEWAYPDNPDDPYLSLDTVVKSPPNDFPFTFRGAAGKREDGGDTWKIEHYQPYKKNGTKPESTRELAARRRAEAAEEDDEAPF